MLRKTFKFYFYKKNEISFYIVILLIFTSLLHDGYKMCKCMIKSFYKTCMCYIFIFFKYIQVLVLYFLSPLDCLFLFLSFFAPPLNFKIFNDYTLSAILSAVFRILYLYMIMITNLSVYIRLSNLILYLSTNYEPVSQNLVRES